MRILSIFLFLCCQLFSLPYEAKSYSYLLGMPGFSDSLLQMHFELYGGYVKNVNKILDQLSKMKETGTIEYSELKRRLGWEFDGMRLHELYFSNLGGTGVLPAKSALFRALVSQFGSYEEWRRDFVATGSMRGIGWALLYFDPQQERLVNVWINEHDTGHFVQCTPLLIMDVFEHAYMPQYGLNKAKYIEAFFNNIDWDVVWERYRALFAPADQTDQNQ